MTDAFSRLHPLVSFTFFALMLTFTMLTMHPACIAVTLLCALVYTVYLLRGRALRLIAFAALPTAFLTALINPLFNHRGVTVLWYFPGGNPLTLESVIYGVMAGCMFAAVLMWFFCLNRVFTSEKLIWLFGRIIPGLSLVLSMILRFVPRFSEQLKEVSAAQKCLGRNVKSLRGAAAVFSVMITRTLEDGLVTAASMRSRGYGLPGRSAYTPYRITGRDAAVIFTQLALGAAVGCALFCGRLDFSYYPSLSGGITPFSALALAAYAVLGITPMIINIKEDIAWKRTAYKT